MQFINKEIEILICNTINNNTHIIYDLNFSFSFSILKHELWNFLKATQKATEGTWLLARRQKASLSCITLTNPIYPKKLMITCCSPLLKWVI